MATPPTLGPPLGQSTLKEISYKHGPLDMSLQPGPWVKFPLRGVVCKGSSSRLCLHSNPEDVTFSRLLNLAQSPFPHLKNGCDGSYLMSIVES